MFALVTRYWWAFALQGGVAVSFGILAILWPRLTLRTLVLLFGAYALVDGAITLISRIAAHDRNQRWWTVVLRGAAGILIGVLTFVWPGLTALALLYFIAAWESVTGLLPILAGIQLRRVITNEWLLCFSGAVSIVFGLILLVFPGAGAISLLWLIASYSIAFGILRVFLAFRLRSLPPGVMANAAARPPSDRRCGYRRVTALLKRQGENCNPKRVWWIWQQEQLSLSRRRLKKRRASVKAAVAGLPTKALHRGYVWSYDFIFDWTERGAQLKILGVLDEYTRECHMIKVGRKLDSSTVQQVLAELFVQHGAAEYIRSAKGGEFIARELQAGLEQMGTQTVPSAPGHPWANG